MQWNPDDVMMGGCARISGVPDTPAEWIAENYYSDPMIQRELSGMVQEWELMGYDLEDSELMGAFLKTLVGKIKSRIQARKKKKSGGTVPTVSVKTESGTAQLGPGGLTFTSPTAKGSASAKGVSVGPVSMPSTTSTGGIADMLKNPMVLAAAAGIPLLLMMMKGRK